MNWMMASMCNKFLKENKDSLCSTQAERNAVDRIVGMLDKREGFSKKAQEIIRENLGR